MIFYFTGTGNSLDIAKRMHKGNEKLLSIAECLKNEEYEFTLNDNEKLGFIFPVYFYNVPNIVKNFISKLTIENTSYTYSIITCGGGIAQTASVLNKELNKRNIKLNYVSKLLMPDNALIYYPIDDIQSNIKLLKTSYEQLEKIKEDINCLKEINFGPTIISDLVGSMYNFSLSTHKFYIETEKCISCKKCENSCPINAIKIINNKPTWVKEKCVKCLACINICPKEAIQYGKLTKKRHRYANPNIFNN